MIDNEFKDRRLKYVELPKVFHVKASEINISSKQHLRICERLANHLSKQRPKTPKEFEQVEYLKDFVMKSAKLNEQMIALLDYLKIELDAIAADSKSLIEGSYTLDIIKDQQEIIVAIQQVRDNAVKALYEARKN